MDKTETPKEQHQDQAPATEARSGLARSHAARCGASLTRTREKPQSRPADSQPAHAQEE